jgi:hypothetical protein
LSPTSARRGAFALTCVAAAALTIAALTLFPVEGPPQKRMELCLLCGERGAADAILNVFLFAPLGAALALRGTSAGRAVLVGAAFSAAIELCQHLVPGRDPSPADILFNTLGTTLGMAVLRCAPGWLHPPPRRAAVLLVAGVLLPLAVVAAGGWLLAPELPRSVYYGQWTADLGYLEWYRGRVAAAWVGEIPVPSWRMERESPRLRALLLRGAPIRVVAVAGPPPASLAPVFSIYDDRQREVVLAGIDGEDAVFRYRTRGMALRMDQPEIRLPAAFRGVRPGDRLRLAVARRGRGYCVEGNTAGACSLGYTVADTWAVLLFASSLTAAGRRLVGMFWMAGLFFPVGLWLRGPRRALAACAGVAGGLLAIPLATVLLPTPASALLAALAGMGAGGLIRRVAGAAASVQATSAADG